jgi:hypothetical protein
VFLKRTWKRCRTGFVGNGSVQLADPGRFLEWWNQTCPPQLSSTKILEDIALRN